MLWAQMYPSAITQCPCCRSQPLASGRNRMGVGVAMYNRILISRQQAQQLEANISLLSTNGVKWHNLLLAIHLVLNGKATTADTLVP